jgi:chromosomal replication initiator protein
MAHSIHQIMRATCTVANLAMDDLKGPCKRWWITRPRMAAMIVARDMTGASLKQIGIAFGGKHHATVIHALKQADVPEVAAWVERVRNAVAT